jgi:phage shock protein C
MNSVRASFARAGFVRSRDSKVLGGVCAGVGRHFGIEPGMSRVLFLVALLAIPGSQILVYPVLWFCMPLEGDYVPVETVISSPST